MSGEDVTTARQARQALGLREEAGLDEIRRAFRAAVRQAHPDRGGDVDALRRVIDAHRLLTELHKARLHLSPTRVETPARPSASARPKEPHAWRLEITVAEAICGAHKKVRLPDGRAGRLGLPPGLRPGEVVRLKTAAANVYFTIAYAAGPLEVRGDDVWMTAAAPSRIIADGGEIEIAAPTGRKLVIVTPGADTLRLSGQGLPARGGHAQGHLFVRLIAQAAPNRNRARDLLRRFTAAWAA